MAKSIAGTVQARVDAAMQSPEVQARVEQRLREERTRLEQQVLAPCTCTSSVMLPPRLQSDQPSICMFIARKAVQRVLEGTCDVVPAARLCPDLKRRHRCASTPSWCDLNCAWERQRYESFQSAVLTDMHSHTMLEQLCTMRSQTSLQRRCPHTGRA